MNAAYVNAEKVKDDSPRARWLRFAARHNLREGKLGRKAEKSIDAPRTHLNMVLVGPSSVKEVLALNRSTLEAVGMKVGDGRYDAVRHIEVVVTWPRDWDETTESYFRDSLAWVRRFYDDVPVLSATVHRDEGAPHMHVILLPLRAGCLQGSEVFGGPQKVCRLQTDFYESVARHYGLARVKVSLELVAEKRREDADAVLACLCAAPEQLAQPKVRDELHKVLGKVSLRRLKESLGLADNDVAAAPPARRISEKSFVGIMTQPVNPEPKPIGFAPPRVPAVPARTASSHAEAYLCVAFEEAAPGLALEALPHQPGTGNVAVSRRQRQHLRYGIARLAVAISLATRLAMPL